MSDGKANSSPGLTFGAVRWLFAEAERSIENAYQGAIDREEVDERESMLRVVKNLRKRLDDLESSTGQPAAPDGEPDEATDEIRMIRAASSLSTIIHTTKDREMMRRLVPVREYLRRNPQFPKPYHTPTGKDEVN